MYGVCELNTAQPQTNVNILAIGLPPSSLQEQDYDYPLCALPCTSVRKCGGEGQETQNVIAIYMQLLPSVRMNLESLVIHMMIST